VGTTRKAARQDIGQNDLFEGNWKVDRSIWSATINLEGRYREMNLRDMRGNRTMCDTGTRRNGDKRPGVHYIEFLNSNKKNLGKLR
jgi:hypothetical protein